MKKFVQSIFALLLSTALPAQDIMNLDSLLQLLPAAKADSNQVRLLVRIGWQYEGSEPEIAGSYYRRAGELSRKIGFNRGEISYIHNYTYLLNLRGLFDSSLVLNLQSVELARGINDTELLARSLFNTGTTYSYLSEYPRAVDYYLQGYALFEKLGMKATLAQAEDILQTLYTGMHQYPKALAHGRKAVAMAEALGNTTLLGMALSNLGVVYAGLQQIDSSAICHQKALSIARETDNRFLEASSLVNIGDVFLKKKDYPGAQNNYSTALALSRSLNFTENEAISLRGLALHYLYTRNYGRSRLYADSALLLAQQFQLPDQLRGSYLLLSELAFLEQDIDKGEHFARLARNTADSLLNESILKATTQLEKRYELEKKDAQIQLQEASLQQKNIVNAVLIGAALALLLILFLFYRNYQTRKKLQEQRISELEAERQLLATQSLLKGQEEERNRLAKDLHDGLGGLLSGVKLQLGAMKGNLILTDQNGMAFNRALDKLDESISEMRRIAHNMTPEALLKFGLAQALQDYCESLSAAAPFTIHCEFHGLDQRMDDASEIVLYRIVQELLNNAVKHADASSILVQVIQPEPGRVTITVEDNGKGFDSNRINANTSSGLKNIQSRVHYLKGRMDIDSAVGKGTSIYIECETDADGKD